MDNDDEIKRLIRKESERFLKHALYQARGGEAGYDFEAEFGKTRRNKSRLVIGATALTILCLAVAAFAVTRVIERNSAAAPVNVSAFEDLNLRDLLDASKQDDAALDRAKITLAGLGADLNSGLEFVDRDYRSSLLTTDVLDLSAGDKERRIAQAAAYKNAAKRKLRSDYAAAAAASRAEIATVQKRVDQYDSRSLAKAKAQQAILENERLAFDIEKGRQAAIYEARIGGIEAAKRRDISALGRQKDELAAALTARYNPTLVDARSAALLSSRPEIPAYPLAPFDPYLASSGILDPQAEAGLDASFADSEYLASKLKAVPYINSVPGALSRIAEEARSSVTAYRAALQAAGSGLAARDGTIAALEARAGAAEGSLARFLSLMTANAREGGAIGYVLDARGGSRLLVFLDPSAPVREGSLGYVVRDGILIATVSFGPRGGDDYASVTKTERNGKPRAFDPIMAAISSAANRPLASK